VESIEIDIYCDEVKESSIQGPDGENETWIYIGFLIIPCKQKMQIFSELMKMRCKNGNDWSTCTDYCGYHEKNGKEIHYQHIKSADIYHIADRWIDYFIDSSNMYFYALGLNLSRLNLSFFGDCSGSERYYRIYNRFFRTAIQKSVKTYFSDAANIKIRNVYHDNADIENHEYFQWHSIYKLEKTDEKLSFGTDKIQFIDSDHRKSNDKNSHFVQMADLLLGLFYNSFHFCNNGEKAIRITEKVSPIWDGIIRNPWDRSSRYGYVKRIDFDFFPKFRIDDEQSVENQLLRYTSFYKNRPILIQNRLQSNLFD
jgi:hypothetical protein